MDLIDTLSFPNFDPVTGQPTIDGWTGNHDPGVVQSFAEPGFAPGGRITYAGGVDFPPVVFESVKVDSPAGMAAGSYLALSFFCTFDPTFDDEDVVVIAVRSDGAPENARRIDIFPIHAWGAGGFADVPTTLPGTPAGSDYQVRLGKLRNSANYWAGNPAGSAKPWRPIGEPGNIAMRVTSWVPPTVATTAPAQALPAAGTTFTLDVASTGGFPPTGTISVPSVPATINYTGKTPTSFTGCTADATGSVAAASPVQLKDVGWSLEVLLPMSAALGGADWFDLLDGFGLYFNIVRVTTHGPAYATQFVFPVPEPGDDTNLLVGVLGEDTVIQRYGTAKIPGLLPPGSAVGFGVRFVNHTNPALSVGVRPTSAGAWSALGDELKGGTSAATPDNRLVAQVENTATASADHLTAEFRFANWGLPPATFPAWAPAGGATPDYPTTPGNVGISVAAGTQAELSWTWPHASVPSQYSGHHECVWVRLDSAATTNFVESGVRRNMNFAVFSEVEQDAEISGAGYPAPPGGSHDFVLFPHSRSTVVYSGDDERRVAAVLAGGRGTQRVWWWVVDGARRTGKKLTIGKRTFDVLDPSPGQFGVIGVHDGVDDVLGAWLSGGGIQPHGRGWRLKVPHNGSVRVKARIAIAPPAEIATIDEQMQQRPEPWWLRLLRWLLALIRRLFGGT
jgi:hypothetical protein